MKKKRKSLRVASAALVCAMTATSVLPAAAAKKNEETTPAAPAEQNDCSKDPNAYAIYPLPQKVTYPKQKQEFTLDKEKVTIVTEKGVDEHTKKYVKEVLKEYGITPSESQNVQSGNTNIILGVEETEGAADKHMKEKSVSQNDKELFKKSDAYILDADAKSNTIVIEGKDTDATFHGVSTLQMMFSSFSGKKFLDAHIEDYATVATRGYIEGFYGAWDFKERASLMEFAKDYKMNSYVYAAKGDEYHTNKWDQLYPQNILDELKKLVEKGRETKVEFAWSIHLGKFFGTFKDISDPNFKTQYKKLTDKLDQLIGIGVKRIDVLNDDFGGGSHDTVVEVLNQINGYLKGKGCKPLTYCPQGYNQAWSGKGEELEAMKKLDKDINIYWTGADVNAPITQETVDFLKTKTNHNPDYWLNYPVNEHASSGIFLGDITYYARDNVTGLAGFHSNPSRFAYANEVGLYQLAALVWNNKDYSKHATEVWESAFNYLQPEVKDAYLTIARNISNAPNSSRVPGFNESEYLAETLEAVQKLVSSGKQIKENKNTKALLKEFEHILTAITEFTGKCENKDLVKELTPWLNSLRDVVTAGKASLESVIALEEGKTEDAWAKFSDATKAYDTKYTYPTIEGEKNYAKSGTKRLVPFVTKVMNEAKNRISPIVNPGDTSISPTLYAKMGGKDQVETEDAKKMYDGDETTYASWSVNQEQGDYYGLDLGKVTTVTDVSILQGKEDGHWDKFHDAVLQYSEDGEKWEEIKPTVNGDRITADGLNVKARYVRYFLKTKGTSEKPNYWTCVREFTVNKKVEEHDRIYTNVEALKKTPLTIEGTEVSVRGLKNVILKKDDYVGIKLETPEAVKSFVKELSNTNGLVLEHSFDELNWTAVSETKASELVGVKYLRLRNSSNQAMTLDINKIGMDIKSLKPDAKVLQSTIKNGLGEGSYDNVFDDNLSTYIVTKENPGKDTYVTYDLGKTIEVYDVAAVTSDGPQRLYNAKIQISENNREWKDVATVSNDNSTMEVPYRYVRGNGEGAKARYLRLYFTENGKDKLKLHEIQINKKTDGGVAAAKITSNIDGDLGALIDNDITTLLSKEVKKEDYIRYRVTDNTNVTKISVLQGKAGKGELYVVTSKGEQKVGTLGKTISEFDVQKYGAISEILIKWSTNDTASIHELSIVTGENKTDDIGEYTDPDVIGGDAIENNIAIGKVVAVSGTSDGDKDHVNDGKLETKWDSDPIKGDNAKKFSWVSVDLGTEKVYKVSQLVVHFYNKIYPTQWQIQTSNDGERWTTIKELTKADNGPTSPVETINLDTPVTARYFRLYFTKLNTVAAGNGVGVQEFEIFGKEKKDDVTDKNTLNEVIKEAEGKVESKDYTKASKESLKAVIAEAKKVAENENATQDQVTQATVKLQEALKSLQLKITEQQNIGLKKTVTVSGTSNGKPESINDGDETTKWDSDLIKGEEATSEEAWFAIDLGEQTNLIDGLKVSYFNKVYPINYEVQVSNDNKTWTTVKTLTREHDGEAHPKDDIQFETPVSARYVKMLFKEMNSAAAGHGIGINDAQVIGRYVHENASVQSVSGNMDIFVQKDSAFDNAKLPTVNRVWVTVEEMKDPMKVLVPVTWKAGNVDMGTEDTHTVDGMLSLNDIVNTENKKASVNVVVQGEKTEEIDYKALEEQFAIAKTKEQEQDKYTEESYDAFKIAYENAQNIKENAITQKVVDRGTKTLKNAIAGLKEKSNEPETPEVDKKELQAKVDEYDRLDPNAYTADSWEIFEQVLADAKAVLADDKATQETVNAMLQSLVEAYGKLEKAESKVDKTKLQAKVDEYSKLDSNTYTTDSWEAFVKVLDKAKAVLADGNVTQDTVNAMLQDLVQARENLKEAETPNPQPEVDKSKLQEKVDAYNKLEEKAYTPDSWKMFAKALADAKAVLADENATQSSVDKALEVLNTAYGALKETTTQTELDKNKPDSKKPVKTGDPTSVFGIFSSMILASGYILGRRKKDDN